MAVAQDVFETGREVAAADRAGLETTLAAGLAKHLGWPYKVAPAAVVDRQGISSSRFAAVVYVSPSTESSPSPTEVPADSAAAVIDATTVLSIDALRAAYARIAQVKRLKKTPAPTLDRATTTITLGLIYAQSSSVPLETLAEELERHNAQTPGREWPDMVAVGTTGAIQYAVQFPGEGLSGDYLPPAEGALSNYVPAMYVVIVMRPAGNQTFNKLFAFLLAHLGIFSPGARIPNFAEVLEGVPKTAIVIAGFQYDLKGNLKPVPRDHYQDRLIPTPPLQIEDSRRQLLATIRFLPWQDGGAIMLRGKLPLIGILPFLERADLLKAGVINRPPDVQISYVLPITPDDFGAMLMRFQQRSNMAVRKPQGHWIVQKMADEGSASPFVARLFMGLLKLRDAVLPDPATRENFDKAFDFVPTSLTNARATAKEIRELWAAHVQNVTSGKAVRRQGQAIHIDESIDKDLRKQVEHFLNAAVRVVKQGMQNLTTELGTDIGFMFKKQRAFESGLAALKVADPALADYLEKSRRWTERLINSRNALEHSGWALPRVTYDTGGAVVSPDEPQIDGQPVTEFVDGMLDRLCSFVEEVSAHCLQQKMPAAITITEVPQAERRPEAPERFTITLAVGGLPRWAISYHATRFEET
jgi:hypothetical protein